MRHTTEAGAEFAHLELFSACSPHDLEVIDQCSTIVGVAAGATIGRQGSAARECFVVLEGEVEILDGDTRIAVVGPGQWVGEMAAIEGTLRCATVRTVRESRILAFNTAEFQRVLREVPALADKARLGVASRHAENDRRAS